MAEQRVARGDLEARVVEAFVASRTSAANAAVVARALVQAQIDGLGGHGLSRVESYTAQAISGKVDGFATPTLASRMPASALVDAAHGFAYPAVQLAGAHLIETCKTSGIAAVSITRSHHAGAVGWHCEQLAEHGLLALFFANTPKAMTPWGGRNALFGTNPIAFAAPRRSGPPIVIDLALSQVARGKILRAAQTGTPIPEGWATDAEGQPTTDAKAALAGTLNPIGDAKGAALALMVELLAVALGGAQFAAETTSFFDAEGKPPGVGQLMIAINPDGFAGRETVLERIETLATAFDDNGSARLPGSRKAELRQEAERDGIVVPPDILSVIDQRRSVSSLNATDVD